MARGPRGGALVLRAGDRVLADLRIGWEDGAHKRPWRPETQALGFSATKGLASMVIHRLADRGLIDYDEQVATYWQEFAAAGKGGITVRELLSHRAGLYDVQAVARNAEDLMDHIGMERRLAASTPEGPPGRPAYHAITFGWLASGLGRAVTGKGMRELVRIELAEPLGTSGLEIGTGDGPTRPAEMVGRSLRFYTAFGIAATPLLGWLPVTRAGFRALHAPGFEQLCRGPDPAVWRTEMPAVNGALSADGLSRLYVPLANGGLAPDGRPFLSADTSRASAASRHAVSTGSLASACAGASASTTPSPSASRHPAPSATTTSEAVRLGRPRHGRLFRIRDSHIGNFTTAIGDLGILRLTAVARACAARAL